LVSTQQHDAPFKNPPADLEEVEVTDPTHPLFGRRFPILSISHPPHYPGHVFVAYREGVCLRIAVAATNLGLARSSRPCTKLTRAALLDLLCLVKECAASCPDQPNASGPGSPTI
jgi:hypothetical protein